MDCLPAQIFPTSPSQLPSPLESPYLGDPQKKSRPPRDNKQTWHSKFHKTRHIPSHRWDKATQWPKSQTPAPSGRNPAKTLFLNDVYLLMYVGWLRVHACYGICGALRGKLVRVSSLLLYVGPGE